MLVRIVKLSFHQDKIPAFLENFELVKNQIRNFPGNRLLELYQDKTNTLLSNGTISILLALTMAF